VHYICGDAPNPEEEIRRLCDLMAVSAIDIAFIGIGENGHIAFNDPPADFETEEAYIRVQLDEVCRRQQLDEGWFSQLDEVPRHAITMSVQQIMKSRHIICSVPGSRKAAAVQAALEGPPDPRWPASILNRHPHCSLFLDSESASLLSEHARVRQGL
jgi:glucosamine-6-phosphate deaminase